MPEFIQSIANCGPRRHATWLPPPVWWLLLILLGMPGCRSGSGGNIWPWSATNPSPAPNQTAAAQASSPPSMAGLNELFQRQDAQTQLAAEQRRALEELAEWQAAQQREMEYIAQQRADGEMQELERQAELVRRQQREIDELSEFRRRALELDSDNQRLHAQLAQTQQQNRLLQDQTQLLQQQLRENAQQLALAAKQQQEADRRLLVAQQDADQRVSELQATLPRQGTATIRANSSLRQQLTPIEIAGVNVRQDVDVIRIELPSDTIFSPGTASLTPEAVSIVDQVATAVQQSYARQTIGIEAHTDNATMPGGSWQSRHELTAAQAMAIFDQLVQRHGFQPQQLFVLGHGGNYPIASNATPAGQQRNRRVEMVIYPEVVGQK